MNHDIQAVYEKGVLRPLVPLALAEHQQVAITVHAGTDDWLDAEVVEMAAREVGIPGTLEDLRQQLKPIQGSLSESVIAERGDY